MLRFIFCLTLLCVAHANIYGADVKFFSTLSTSSAYETALQCMSSDGVSIFISQTLVSGVTPTVYDGICDWLGAAESVGIKSRDLLFLMAVPLNDNNSPGWTPTDQIQAVQKYLADNCPTAFNGRFWINADVSESWNQNSIINKQFVMDTVDALVSMKIPYGYYTFEPAWKDIFHDKSFTYPADNGGLLWNISPGPKELEANGTVNFGGWTQSTIEQYSAASSYCGVNGVGMDKA